MDNRENDIFNQSSKVQNMNHIFDEDDDLFTNEEPSAAAPSEKPRQTASARAPRNSQGSQRSQQRPRSSKGGQRSSSSRSSQGRSRNTGSSQTRKPQNRQARPVSDRTSDAQRPRRVQADNIDAAEARQPRQANPEQARPRQVRPSSQRPGSSRSGSSSDRVNRSSGRRGSSRKRSFSKREGSFKKFLLIYSAALLVLLIIGMIIFGSFLGSLEKSQPARIAEDAAENLTATKAEAYLSGHADAINSFGDPKDLITQFVSNVQGVEQLSYIENNDYRADAPSYNITADGNTIAKLTLEKDGSGSFGLSKWKIGALDIADYMNMASFEILAPVGTTVSVNGVQLDDKFVTGEEGIPEELATASKYVAIPSYITYKVSGVPGTPEITAKDPAGNDLLFTATEGKYVIGAVTTPEFIDSVSPLVDKVLDAWGRHFINMGGNLSAYMLEGSDWYSYIFGGPNMDPIMTSFYEFESIANYAFTEKSAGNYIHYTDDCFTVDVHYKMQVDFTTDRMSDNNQKLDATWVFITQNGGQDWYLIDCIYK